MHVIDVAETTLTLVHAEPPTVTVEPLAKYAPVIVIAVPPAVEPEIGDTAVTVGGGVTFPEYFLIAPPMKVVYATIVSPDGLSDDTNVPFDDPDPGSQPVQLDVPLLTMLMKPPVDESRTKPDSAWQQVTLLNFPPTRMLPSGSTSTDEIEEGV